MPDSLPPSPPASEQSETEQQPSQPRVDSVRVTRSQTRARKAAGLPSLLVGSSASTPMLNLSDIVYSDEVDGSRKQPRLALLSPTNLASDSNPPSDDSDESSLFPPRRRSSDEWPEPGADGTGSSTYHALIPPNVPNVDSDELAASSFDAWRRAQRPIIVQQRWRIDPSSSSPDEISGPLPTTPFGPEPRVSFGFSIWPGPYVRVVTFIYARRVQSSPTSDSRAPSPSPAPVPDSLPPSPPGGESHYVEAFLESGEGALDGIMSEAEAPSTTSQDYRPSCQSSAVGSASRELSSFRGSLVDVTSEFRGPSLPVSRG
eukprot:5002968-Pleurochrysis_carterae.AAC.1